VGSVHGQVLAVSDGFHGELRLSMSGILGVQAVIDKMAWKRITFK